MRAMVRVLGSVVTFLMAAAMARAGEVTVTLNTSVLMNSPAGQFYLGFELADGSLTGDGNNAVVVSNFQFGGGGPLLVGDCMNGVSGNLATSIVLTDASGFALCSEPFDPGTTLGFTISYTNNVDTAGLPDELVVAILDYNHLPIPTTGGIALLQIDFNGPNPTVQVFAGDPTQAEAANGGYGIAIPAPVVSGTLPTAPLLVSPTNGGTGMPVAPTLTWGAAAGATSYDVYFGAGGSPAFVTNTTATTYSAGALFSGASYSWYIVARNASGTAPSSTWSFTTQTGLQFYPVTPCRLVDTRGTAAGFNGIAPFSGPSIVSGQTVTFPVQSAAEATANISPAPCGTIPSTVQAYSLNVTVVPHVVLTDQFPGAVNYLSLWPSGATQPVVSTLNDGQGEVLANAAIVPAGTPSGGISIYNTGPSTADVILDLNGYFAATTTQGSVTGLQFYPVSPCRLVDTRGAGGGFNGISPFSGPSIAAGALITIPVQSAAEAAANTTPAPCGTIPSTAQAYSLNLTVVPKVVLTDTYPGAIDYVTIWPAGVAQPIVSTLNDQEALVVANAAIVPAGSGSGGISVYNAGPSAADVILDLNGYFAP